MKWPGNKHKKKLRGVKKSISWPQLRFTNPPKEQTEVSMGRGSSTSINDVHTWCAYRWGNQKR